MKNRADGSRQDAVPPLPGFGPNWQGHDPNVMAAVRAYVNVALRQDSDFREDADTLYVSRALDYQIARTVEVLRTASNADLIVPTSREIPVGTETASYRIFDAVGMAAVISANPDDLPRVDVRAIERFVKVQGFGVEYAYTRKDIRAAIRSGSGLPQRKADAARAAMEQLERRIMVRGNAAYGMYGVLNHPNMPQVAPTNGLWSDPARTAEQMRDDYISLVSAIPVQSKNNFRAARVGMPYQLRIAATRKYATGNTGKTAMQMIEETFPDVQVVEVSDLAGAGSGGTHCMFATTFNTQHGAYESVMPFTEYPPQIRNMEFAVPCEAESAGFINYQPLAHAMMGGL